MPSLLRSRIYCFYCGSKSPHRKGDKIDRFQCAQCEGTNYLDEHGDITDVPHEPVATPTRPDQRYAVPREPSLSPPQHKDNNDDPLFCKHCLTNQHFLSQRLADYLPDEDHPRYEEFLVAYPTYKKDLEKRYPPVCSGCEPKVKERLKKTSYAAKSDILARSLGKQSQNAVRYSAVASQQGPLSMVLLIVEAAWWVNSLVQGAWHLLGAKEALQYSGKGDFHVSGLHTGIVWRCVTAAVQGHGTHPFCNIQFSIVLQLCLWTAFILLWWNPAILRLQRARTVNKFSFYALQGSVLLVRAAAWWSLKDEHDWNEQTIKAAHALTLAVIAMNLLLAYRVIAPAPRQRVEFRNLDVPLVDKDAVQHPQDQFISRSTPTKRDPTAFKIGNLRPKNEFSLTSISSGSSLSNQPRQRLQTTAAPIEEDSMDWEPSHVQPMQPFRSRTGRPESPIQSVQLPARSPVNSFGAPKNSSPFYGSLPAAPKSLEAKIRGAAQNPPPQFKPASDSKQADWFKRMGLAQSQTSWANKDYVRTVDREDERDYELAAGKLNLETLGLQKDAGTGLEDLFGRSFHLNDDSPIKETAPEPQSTYYTRWGIIEISAMMLPLLLAIWLAVTYLAPSYAWSIGSWSQGLADQVRDKLTASEAM
ncbi:Ima1 N-terminal domain-containing protein [Elsinoe fawcettii]|nr:Ima1 N-terminal domain-containing protein [Elsinoe fawcettii]